MQDSPPKWRRGYNKTEVCSSGWGGTSVYFIGNSFGFPSNKKQFYIGQPI